jgi:tyrosyl-tRNA synthetase
VLILQVGGATGRIGDPSGHTTDRPELQSAVANSNVHSIRENIQRIFSNHEQYLWDKQSSTRTLAPAMYVNYGFQVNGELYKKIMYSMVDMF